MAEFVVWVEFERAAGHMERPIRFHALCRLHARLKAPLVVDAERRSDPDLTGRYVLEGDNDDG